MTRLVLSLLVAGSLACVAAPALAPEPPAAPDRPQAKARVASEPPPSEYRFAFVTLGGPHRRSFVEAIDKGGPALLDGVWAEYEWYPALASMVERVHGSAEQRDELKDRGIERGSVVLDRGTVAEYGFTPPSEPLWLIGPAGPCRADYAEPVSSWYSWLFDAVEISWRLVIDEGQPGCVIDDSKEWSQIGVIAESLPADLRYIPAVERQAGRLQASSPYAELVEAAAATVSEVRADELWVREVGVPGTELVELTIAVVQRGDQQPRVACSDQQENRVVVGLSGDASFSRFELITADGPLYDWVELRGAFVRGAEVVWTVHQRYGDAYVNAPWETPSTVMLPVASFVSEDFSEWPFSQVEHCGP